jgi:glycosyltransferase involved in cell wall biosynthesis
VTKPRVLFVGRTRYRLPLAPSLRRKFEALGELLDVRVLAAAAPGSAPSDQTFSLVAPLRPRRLDGAAFWLALPFRTARVLREFRPDAMICQTAYEAAAALVARRVARVPARVVVEVHADWRTSTRLYGSPARRLLAGTGDRVAAYALRHSDSVRTVSPFTASLVHELGVEPDADFPAYMDLEPFLRELRPLPAVPSAVFVGVLEHYKNIDLLADAWRTASRDVPGATLHVVGDGTRRHVVEELVSGHGARWDNRLSSEEVADALDDAWLLVLPSRSEGMGRVLVEAFCRGRGVIGTRAGSIPDLVEDGTSGILVEAGDVAALAAALVRGLSDRALAERLGAGSRAAARFWLQTPEQYAQRVRELVTS